MNPIIPPNVENEIEINWDAKKSEHTVVAISPTGGQKNGAVQSVIVIGSQGETTTAKDKTARRRRGRAVAVSPMLSPPSMSCNDKGVTPRGRGRSSSHGKQGGRDRSKKNLSQLWSGK